jgi:hypothetical protein
VRKHFDALSASQGAASLGLILLFAVAGSIALANPADLATVLGTALLASSAFYFAAMISVGRLARTGGLLDSRFDFRAGSHGAAGFCIVALLACAGVFTLNTLWENRTAWGLALLLVSAGCASGMAVFGRICCSSGSAPEPTREPIDDSRQDSDEICDAGSGS